jgi:hypothetical protein
MKSRLSFWPVALLVLFFLAPCVFAQESMTLTGPNPNYSWYDTNYNEQVSVGPYAATVNGVANQQIICDDYSDEVSVGEKWNVSAINVSNLTVSNLGSTMWGATMGATSTVLTSYLEAAWLTEQLIAANSVPNNGALVTAIQYAEWAIFNPNAKTGGPQGSGQTSASYWYNLVTSPTVSQNLSASQFSNLELLTPLTSSNKACQANAGCAQEYFMVVAEGGAAAMYLLLASIACFGAMFLRSRRQNARVEMA